jgi:hypothetical protein
MAKISLDYCLREMTYNSKNITREEWQEYFQNYNGNVMFKKKFFECPNVPSDLIYGLVRDYVLFNNDLVAALQNPQLSSDAKLKFIIPVFNGSQDLLHYIDDTFKNNKYIDIDVVDFLIENSIYNDDLRTEAYRLITPESKFYPLIKEREYDKLLPAFKTSNILSNIVNNPNLPLEDRINAFKDGCDIICVSNPPKEIISQLLDIILPSLTEISDDNLYDYVHLLNALNELLDNNKITDQQSIKRIIDKCQTEESVVVKAINLLKDEKELTEATHRFDSPMVLYAITQNPCFNKTDFNELIRKKIDFLDDFLLHDTNSLSSVVNELNFLISSSKLPDDLYQKIINGNKTKIIDFVAHSYYTPEYILKEISEKFPTPKYQLLYELNKNKDGILPSMYDTIINFVFTHSGPVKQLLSNKENMYPYIMPDNLFVHAKIDFKNFKSDVLNNNSYNRDLQFESEQELTIKDDTCYENFSNAIKNVSENSYTALLDRRLKLVKHYFDYHRNLHIFCNQSPVAKYVSYNFKNENFEIDFGALHNVNKVDFEKQVNLLSAEEISYFADMIKCATCDFKYDDEKMLNKLVADVCNILDESLDNKNKQTLSPQVYNLLNTFKETKNSGDNYGDTDEER